MTVRPIALAFAAILFSAAGASAATANKPVRHAHTTAHPTAAHSRVAPATGPDHSADSLNAQSLTRSQGATQ